MTIRPIDIQTSIVGSQSVSEARSQQQGLEQAHQMNPNSEIEEIERKAKEEVKKMLAESINKLNDRERLVITLYYFEELTSKEIGSILGVSDSRVSQLHTKAILRLRGRLSKIKRTLLEE